MTAAYTAKDSEKEVKAVLQGLVFTAGKVTCVQKNVKNHSV